MRIREATEADMAAITAIYNHTVAHTTAIWNETEASLANRLAWRAERLRAGYPFLVAVAEKTAVGKDRSKSDRNQLIAANFDQKIDHSSTNRASVDQLR